MVHTTTESSTDENIVLKSKSKEKKVEAIPFISHIRAWTSSSRNSNARPSRGCYIFSINIYRGPKQRPIPVSSH